MDKRIRFKYNNKIYQTVDLEKKLKRLNITESDIELIENSKEEIDYPVLHHFINKDNHTITTIKDNLDDLNGIYNIKDWKQID